MSRELLERYARLIATDPAACAGLFAEDGDYITRVNDKPVRLTGRLRILNFLSRRGEGRSFRVGEHRVEGDRHVATLIAEPPGAPAVEQTVRFVVEEGLFKSLRITGEREITGT